MPIARILDTRAMAVWRLQAAQHDIMGALYACWYCESIESVKV